MRLPSLFATMPVYTAQPSASEEVNQIRMRSALCKLVKRAEHYHARRELVSPKRCKQARVQVSRWSLLSRLDSVSRSFRFAVGNCDTRAR